jgi:hypothetical protein
MVCKSPFGRLAAYTLNRPLPLKVQESDRVQESGLPKGTSEVIFLPCIDDSCNGAEVDYKLGGGTSTEAYCGESAYQEYGNGSDCKVHPPKTRRQ